VGESGGEWDNVPFYLVFRGATKVTLDAKGRMVIPTRYRERLQERGDARLVVTIDRDQCLLIYPLPEWEEIERKLMRLPTLNEHARRLQRLMVGYATDVELDGHGRLLLPPTLRGFAHLDRNAMLIGQGNRFELWDEQRWEERREQWLNGEESPASLPAELGSLSL
jgi:transcriptional regulator MraZ